MPTPSTSRVRRGRRPALDRREVLEAALRVVDEHGVNGLTMRRVATTLDVDPMTLYRHVEGKEALLDGVVELIWDEVPAPDDEQDWADAIRAFAAALTGAMDAHPNAIPLLLTRPVMSRAALEVFTSLLERLTDAGVDDHHAARLVRAVSSVVLSDAAAGATFRVSGGAEQPATGPDAWITLAQRLPADTPAHLVRTASAVCAPNEASSDVDFLIELLISGARQLTDHASSRASD